MKNKFRINYSYVVLPLALIAAISVLLILKEYNVVEHKQKYVLKMPPEFFDNHTLAIGDEFEKVAKVVNLRQNWYFDELSGEKKYFSGAYFSETGWYYFDTMGNLESLSLQILNKDSSNKVDFYRKNFHILKKYSGNNFKIYRDKRNLSTLIFEWKVNNEYVVFVEGYDKKSENYNDDDTFLRVEFNNENSLSQELRTTNETLQSLGFE